MAKCEHKNFEIDASVDRQIQNCFEEMVDFEMVKLDSALSVNERRSIAVELVLVKKEQLKLAKKRKAAEKSKRKHLSHQRSRQRTAKSLLKKCLLKQYWEREDQILPGNWKSTFEIVMVLIIFIFSENKEVEAIHEEAKRLMECLDEILSDNV